MQLSDAAWSSPFTRTGRLDASLRLALFGELSLAVWVRDYGGDSQSQQLFREALRSVDGNDVPRAVAALQAIADMPSLRSRYYAEAWSALRALGEKPPSNRAKVVLGVILEVGLPAGADTLVCYSDGSAGYWNHAGKVIVYDGDVAEIAAAMKQFLDAGGVIAQKIGPWTQDLRLPPATGVARCTVLTPSGIHFGEGPFDVLSQDPLGAPMIADGFGLMQRLIALSEKQRKDS